MTTTTIPWNLLDTRRRLAPQRYKIGLVVRGMTAPGRAPSDEGHADCVLSTGEPIGFYADTGIPLSGSGPSGSDGGSATGTLAARAVTATLAGEVWDYQRLLVERLPYVDLAQAASTHTVSTLLAINVSEGERMRFEQAWSAMAVDPGMFGIVGMNCSTHAAYAFAAAGLVTSPLGTRTPEISGPDTPTNLFLQLFNGAANARCEVFTGYLGFTPAGAGTFRITATLRGRPHRSS
ncbi:MAG: hypothetical protein JWN23_1092 [Rhodocyclales bacterium]|nr:hypothetical protein [Rhodocyclales bacterium]